MSSQMVIQPVANAAENPKGLAQNLFHQQIVLPFMNLIKVDRL
jgi:hypothetical protein